MLQGRKFGKTHGRVMCLPTGESLPADGCSGGVLVVVLLEARIQQGQQLGADRGANVRHKHGPHGPPFLGGGPQKAKKFRRSYPTLSNRTCSAYAEDSGACALRLPSAIAALAASTAARSRATRLPLAAAA